MVASGNSKDRGESRRGPAPLAGIPGATRSDFEGIYEAHLDGFAGTCQGRCLKKRKSNKHPICSRASSTADSHSGSGNFVRRGWVLRN
jgi:hypothetical protein